MYFYKEEEEHHYYIPDSLNNFMVTYKGKKISLDEYLMIKEQESYKILPREKVVPAGTYH